MKKTLVWFAVLTLLLGTVNVGHVFAKDTVEIAVAFCTLNIPFFVEMENGVREAAEEAQVRLVVTNAEDSAAKQLSQVEDLITRKPDLLLLAPVDSDVLVSAVEAAHKANIPVITIDRTVNSDKVLTYIGVDDVAGGRAAGQYIAERLNGEGNVIMLEGVMGSSAQRDRAQGFEEAIGEYEGIKLLAKQTANFNRVEGMNVTENLLQAHPDVDAIFAQNDEMALGALRAIEAAGKQDKIVVVGFDADPEAKDAVRLGEMDATVEGSPYKLGVMGIEASLQYLNGETLPSQILIPLELVTQDSFAE
ncbi:MAG: D-ribose ABC transporter substrate-binding protein [Firmicutes bacterium]|nr:D-ribose ABC transporter substrate-binding protein [Bacillota bacterium]